MKNMSKEYALALFMIAREEEREHEYYDSLMLLSDVFSENSMYIDFLSSPRVSREERNGALKEAFGGALSDNVLNFLKLMSDEGQADNFYECVEEYRLLMLQEKKISEAKVTSAVTLTDSEKEKLHEKLMQITGNPVDMEYAVDETLLGGMIVVLDGKIMDGSLRNRLKEMKEVISK